MGGVGRAALSLRLAEMVVLSMILHEVGPSLSRIWLASSTEWDRKLLETDTVNPGM